MIPRAAIILIILARGIASQYAPGVMERVVEYRQTRPVAYALPAELPAVDGFIAVLECRHIGEVWTLRINGAPAERFLVADCAGDDATRRWVVSSGVLCEVDGETARRHGFVGVGARVERVEYRYEGLEAQ
jgi:hypothetical protein